MNLMKITKICLVAIGCCFLGVIALFAYGVYHEWGIPSTRTLQMTWKRGDVLYGPDFIHLESRCTDLTAGTNCFCGMDFKVMSSSPNAPEFAKYVQSFGTARVPVKFTVWHYHNECRLVLLSSVGAWPGSRFAHNDTALGGGGSTVHRGETVKTSGISPEFIGIPCSCFPQSQAPEGPTPTP